MTGSPSSSGTEVVLAPRPPVRRALVSSTASDAHTWNLVFLQLLLEDLGYEVVNLGACVPEEMLVSRCLAERPNLVVLSSVNGHGQHDGTRAITLLRAEPALRSTAVVIGGKLGITGPSRDRTNALLAAGFDGVFEDDPVHGIGAFRSFVMALPGAQL